MSTTYYIFNENGIIPNDGLEMFCSIFESNSRNKFTVSCIEDVDFLTTVFRKYTNPELEFIVYCHGYVMKAEGAIKPSIVLLQDIDRSIKESVSFHISPSQRIHNTIDNEYPRGATYEDIGHFLDKQFCNNDYSSAVRQLLDDE